MLDDVISYVKDLKVYALGKGILTMAFWAAVGIGSWIGGAAAVWPAALTISIGGTILTAVSRLHKQTRYEENMVDLYRSHIAQRLHIAPEEVTRADLRTVAKENPVIAQALDRQRKKTILTICTAAAASAVSLLLIGGFDMGNQLHEWAQSGWLKPVAGVIGMGTVAAMSSLFIHQGLDAAIGYSTGIEKRSANDLIFSINQRVQRGKPISREEVYSVMTAGDEALAQRIEQQFGKAYHDMNVGEQSNVLHEFGIAESMDQLAQQITKHEVEPCQLAYMPTPTEADVAAIPTMDAAPAAEAHGSFVERLGLAAKPEMSHVEQVAARASLQRPLAAL